MTKTFISLVAAATLAFSMAAAAQDADSAMSDTLAAAATDTESHQQFRSIDQDVQKLKKEVLDLNRDLFLLEEELLFPANSQVAFFISMDVGEYFELDSVNLKIDGKVVANYLYTEREVDALIRGGVHRLHMANLKTGDHELIAIFMGKGPHARDYRRGATLTIDKGIGAKYLELAITDRVKKQQPEFVIKEWE
ncbi:MAG: AraC family transcriptional regulator [Woeseiaceae bacterium]